MIKREIGAILMESRTNNTFKNTAAALLEQAIYNIMSFICRTVFVYTLGKTYLGFSGLFGDILTLLSLAELGVGTAILYSMYEPMAKSNYYKVVALLNLYRKVYYVIGILVLLVGLCLTPFLDFFISDIPEMPEIPIIYLLYLANTVSSYFFIYKKSILIVSQQSRVASVIYSGVTTVQNIMQILFLILTRSFIIYLIVQVLSTLLNNVLVSKYVDNHFDFIRKFKDAKVDSKTKNDIYINVRAMFLSKVSSAVVTSTDNILISKFVSTVILGVYSNYTLFITMLRTVISKIFEGLTGSVGNLAAVESKGHVYDTFRKIWFVNYWLVAFCSATLFALINPFIKLWIGDNYLLDNKVVLIICLNMYMRLIRNTFLTFNDAYGHFVQLRFKCLAEAVINLVVSLILVIPFKLGILGVLMGTFISNITTNFWYEPYLLFVKRFSVKMQIYFKLFALYFLVMTVSACVMYYTCNVLLIWNSWFGFIIKLIICIVGINIFYAIVYARTKEFDYLKQLVATKFIAKIKK